MGAVDYTKIKTSIKCIDHILDLEIKQILNEHVSLSMRALVKNEQENQVDEIIQSMKAVLVTTDERLFSGRVINCSIAREEEALILTIEAKSYSYLMDTHRKKRSFQEKVMTYRKLFSTIMNEYPGGSISEDISNGKTIPTMLLQYDETDWEFLKRLASHFYCGIYQDAVGNAPILKMGSLGTHDLGKLENYNFCIHKDIEKYEKLQASGDDNLVEQDAVYYEIESYDSYPMGSSVRYQNNQLYVKEKKAVMEGGILVFHYILAAKNGLAKEKMWIEKVTGLSLPGKVISVDKDCVKLHLAIDQKQEEDKAKFFQYTTIYSASGHAGWYCMPEVGDTVNLYFPSKEEAEAIAVNSIRENDKSLDTVDSSTKLFRTADGKEIKFSSDGITITCSDVSNGSTGERNITYIELKEQEGIRIFSTKPVSIQSDDNLELVAKKKLILSAEDEISIKCKTSQILINDMIDLAGAIININ